MTFDFDIRSSAVDIIHAATAIYTSEHVVDALLDRLNWPACGGRLVDPSAGDGSFLIRALRRLDIRQPDEIMRVSGWEIHTGAAASARERISALLGQHGWSPPEGRKWARKLIVEADFLTDAPTDLSASVIAGNPPYMRFANLPPLFKSIYGSAVPLHARSDMLHAFLSKCAEILPPDGQIGMVTADRWLFNQSAAALRSAIGETVGLAHVARLDPATSFYRPKSRRSGSPPRIHPVEIVLKRGARRICALPISPDGAMPETCLTLGKFASVRIAPWLGPLGIFVVSPDVAATLTGATLLPAVDTDDIEGERLSKPNRFAILTSKAGDLAPAVSAHLKKFRDRMPKRTATRPWWLPPETITLPLDRPSLLVPRIAKELRAIELPAGVLPINHNLSVVAHEGGCSRAELKAILLSERSQKWIRTHAPRLENGYFSITTGLLRRLPIS